jgi:hypothetical protein
MDKYRKKELTCVFSFFTSSEIVAWWCVVRLIRQVKRAEASWSETSIYRSAILGALDNFLVLLEIWQTYLLKEVDPRRKRR